MILTDDFVYIHMPGTGGTFVTAAIDAAYGRRVAAGECSRPASVDKHGTCNDIPASHRHLPVASTVRNPFDRYVGLYEYGWWRKHEMPGIPQADIAARYPHFPDLTFAEFVEVASAHFPHIKLPGRQPGYLTDQFVRYYFPDPAAALARLDPAYVASGAAAEEMHHVRFLRNHRLTDDVCEFLASHGASPADLDAVRALGRVHPPRVRLGLRDLLRRHRPRRVERDWRVYYTPELAALVRRREWFLFSLFPEFDAAGI